MKVDLSILQPVSRLKLLSWYFATGATGYTHVMHFDVFLSFCNLLENDVKIQFTTTALSAFLCHL